MPIFETKQIKQCIATSNQLDKISSGILQSGLSIFPGSYFFFDDSNTEPKPYSVHSVRFGCPLNTSMVYLLPKVFWKNKHLILHEVPTYYLAVVTLNIELIISQVWLPNHEMDRLWKGATTIFTTTSAWLAIYGFEGKKKNIYFQQCKRQLLQWILYSKYLCYRVTCYSTYLQNFNVWQMTNLVFSFLTFLLLLLLLFTLVLCTLSDN